MLSLYGVNLRRGLSRKRLLCLYVRHILEKHEICDLITLSINRVIHVTIRFILNRLPLFVSPKDSITRCSSLDGSNISKPLLAVFVPHFYILISNIDILFRDELAIIFSNIIISYLCHDSINFRIFLTYSYQKTKLRSSKQIKFKLFAFLRQLDIWFRGEMWDKSRKRTVWDLQMIINSFFMEVS